MKTIKIKISIICFLTSISLFSQTKVYWDGGGADVYWSTAANWSNDLIPGPTDICVFDSRSSKSSNLNSVMKVGGLYIMSDYTGTVSLTAAGSEIAGNVIVKGTLNIDFYNEQTLLMSGDTVDLSQAKAILPTAVSFRCRIDLAPPVGKRLYFYPWPNFHNDVNCLGKGTVVMMGDLDLHGFYSDPNQTIDFQHHNLKGTCIFISTQVENIGGSTFGPFTGYVSWAGENTFGSYHGKFFNGPGDSINLNPTEPWFIKAAIDTAFPYSTYKRPTICKIIKSRIKNCDASQGQNIVAVDCQNLGNNKNVYFKKSSDPNLKPVALDDTIKTYTNMKMRINLLKNDYDLDGPFLLRTTSISPITNPMHGTVKLLNRKGDIEYTPNSEYTGTDFFSYSIDDSTDWTTASVFVFVGDVQKTPIIIEENLIDIMQLIPTSIALHASGGKQPYKWRVKSGTLPDGLVLDSITGIISGTPLTIQSTTFTIEVTDSESPTPVSFERLFTLNILKYNISTLISLNKPVIVDSYNGTNVGSNAVDGINTDATKRWISNSVGWPHWIEIDLQGTYDVNQIKFWTGYGGNYNEPVAAYQLQYWNGAAWVDIVNITGNANSSVNHTFTAVSTTKVRLYVTAGSASNLAIKLYEIEIFGIPATGTKIPSTIEDNEEIFIYPNPIKAGELLTISGINNEGILTIKLFDITGKLFQNIAVTTQENIYQINTNQMEKGLYAIQISNNNRIKTQKLIIK